MRIRTLMIHGANAHGLTSTSPVSSRLVPCGIDDHRNGNHPMQSRHRSLLLRWRIRWLLTSIIVLWSVFSCSHVVASAASTVDFSTMTVADWITLFTAASTSTQLPQLYRYGPRVRAKIFVAKSLSMNELFNTEVTLRLRLSEIVGVPMERVTIEYLETNAVQDTARGAWAVSLGISALQQPSTLANASRITDSIDTERERIANCLLYGGIVGQANVTIASLQLFGAPMQLLSLRLDGEAFYQIDTSPWVGLNFVLAADTAASISLVPSLAGSMSISSIDAFQNLRLRLLLARFLRSLELEASSILIRDPWLPALDFQPYNVPAVIVPVEVHIGDDDSLRAAVNGYLRNTSLVAELQDLMPHWTLLAVEVDEDADALTGNSIGATPVSPSVDLPRVQQFEVALLVDKLPLWHVQNRQHAIRDAARTVLSSVLSGYTVAIDFYAVTLAPIVQVTEIVVNSGDAASVFYDNDGSNASITVSPIDRSFVLHLMLTVTIEDNVQPVTLASLRNDLSIAINSQDPRVALGFVDYTDLSLTTFASSHVDFTSVNFAGQESMTFEDATAGASGSTSFVEVSMVFGALESPHSLSRNAALDSFALYHVRCALLLATELVFVNDEDIVLLSVSSIASATTQPAAQVTYRIFLQDEKQREGVSTAFYSGRFTQALDTYMGTQLELRQRVLNLYADGSHAQQIKLPGTDRLVPRGSTAAPPPLPSVSASANGTDYMFTDTLFDANPSVLTHAPADCEVRSEVFLFGCFVLRWNSSFPARSVLLRRISLSPSGVRLQSSNLQLPPATDKTDNSSTSPSINASSLAAPWVPGANSSDDPPAWSFQFLSDSVRNVTLQLWFELADNASSASFPDFQIVADITLSEGRSASEPPYPLLRARQQPSSLLPVTFATAPAIVVTRSANTFATVSLINNDQSWTGLNATLTFAQHSFLGLFDPANAASAWQQQQPTCLSCRSLLETCSQHSECNAIAKCFRRAVNQRLSLFDELLQSVDQRFDLTDVMESCLSSPSFTERVWSTPGRAEFVAGLRCVTQSSCSVTSSQRLSRQLSLQYAPRFQKLRLLPSHLPFSVFFVVDIDGGYGHSTDGHSRTMSTDSVDEITPAALQGIHDTIVSLYGAFARSMEVTVRSSQDPVSNATEITMEYFFWDAGFVGLPFISINWNPQELSAPTIVTDATHSLWLNTSNRNV